MSNLDDDVRTQLLTALTDQSVSSDEFADTLKHLRNYAEAQKVLSEIDSAPEPESAGFRAFLRKNSDALIKVGGTIVAITLIGAFETKGDVIFRTKASKYL